LQDYKFNFKNGCLVAEIRPKWTNKAILFKFLKLCCLSKESKKRALSSHLRRHYLEPDRILSVEIPDVAFFKVSRYNNTL